MPKLEKQRVAHLNNFMYGRLKNTSLVDNREITRRVHDGPLFKVSVPKIEAYKRAVRYKGSCQWNSLPADTRNINEAALFKSKQKAVMLSGI